MMKKLIRITALILALVMLFSFPASAEEYDSRWISFLDYDLGTDNGNYLSFFGTGQFSYTLPFTVSARSFQGLFQANANTVTSVTVQRKGGSPFDCTFVHLGNSLYRFYYPGTPTIIMNSDTFYLNITTSSSSGLTVTLLEFEYTEMRSTQYQEKGSIYVTGGGLDSSYSASMSSVSSSVSCNFPNNLDSSFSFSAQFFISDWKKYDYIDFWISGYVREISSVTAGINGIYLPCSVTELPVSGSDTVTSFSSIVRVDLRSIDRTSTYTPMLVVSGFAYNSPENVQSSISLKNVVGIVGYDETDPLYAFLRLFVNGFEDVNNQLGYLQDQSYSTYLLLYDSFIDLNDRITSEIDELESAITNSISGLQTKLTSLITGFRTSMESWAGTISDKLDQLIGGTTEGDELTDGAEDLESQIGDIDQFEQSQQDVLDNSFPAMQDSVSIGRFSSALAFVQRYINMSWLAIADFSIIYTLPLFIGIFFFICGRLPGATRSNYRPPKNDGGGPK